MEKRNHVINPLEYILIDSSKSSRIDMLNILNGDILVQEYIEDDKMKYYNIEWRKRDDMNGTPDDYKLGEFLGYSDFDLGDAFFEGTNKTSSPFEVKY